MLSMGGSEILGLWYGLHVGVCGLGAALCMLYCFDTHARLLIRNEKLITSNPFIRRFLRRMHDSVVDDRYAVNSPITPR